LELHVLLLVFLFIIPAILAAVSKDLLRSVIALLFCSLGLTLLLFNLNAPLAGVFELSVCAGLISVLFINVISLTEPLSGKEEIAEVKNHYQRFLWLPLVIIIIGIILWINREPLFSALLVQKTTDNATVGEILWGTRGLDLIGQVIVLLVGVYGVVVLFKRGISND
jgi:NADH-quinone oxidoreductase subunit J